MKKPEILSPVGNQEALRAAIQAGCDAVYLAGYTFGARSFAPNFSNEELASAISYAHKYNVKVYVTVNTLVFESEIPMLLDYVDQLVIAHVDALIIQDLGILDLIHQTYPELELHASTQMHLHNVDGVKAAQQLGCQRVVLARETPLDVVKRVKKECQAEVELFVHGALCVSYSGQCLMSHFIGGRSGNRGSCAGSCRQKYTLVKKSKGTMTTILKEGYLLSMKDLNTLSHLPQLMELGVDSFKIEGRMKSPSYVYLVTKLYRNAVDTYFETGHCEIDQDLLRKLDYVFHRSYTKGFLFGEEKTQIVNPMRPNHLGVAIGKVIDVKKDWIQIKLEQSVQIGDGIRILGTEDTGCFLNNFYSQRQLVKKASKGDVISVQMKGSVKVGSQVVKTTDVSIIKEIDALIASEVRKIPLAISLYLEPGEKMVLTLETMEKRHTKVQVESQVVVELAIKSGTTEDRMIEQLSRLGGTVYQVNACHIHKKEEVFIPISILNELRRKAITQLDQIRSMRPTLKKEKYHRQVPEGVLTKKKEVLFLGNVTSEKYVGTGIELFVESDTNLTDGTRCLPKVMGEYPVLSCPVMIRELGGVMHYQNFITDHSFNVTNSYTVALLTSLGAKEVTLSLECNEVQIEELIKGYQSRYHSNPNLALVIYSHPLMMTTKYQFPQVKENDGSYYLKDRFGNLYPVMIQKEVMSLYYDKAIEIKNSNQYESLGIHNFRYEFLPGDGKINELFQKGDESQSFL